MAKKPSNNQKTTVVCDFPFSCTEDSLMNFISTKLRTKVESIRFEFRNTSKHAYINMNTPNDANLLFNHFKSSNYEEVKLNPNIEIKKLPSEPSSILLVKGINKYIPIDTVFDTFKKFKCLESFEPSFNENKESNGFAFVSYLYADNLDKVMKLKNELQKKIGSDNFDISKVEVKSDTKNEIFVSNIDPSINETQFIEYFKLFGAIKRKKNSHFCFTYGSNGASNTRKGSIVYKNSFSAQKALISLKKDVLGHGELTIESFNKKLIDVEPKKDENTDTENTDSENVATENNSQTGVSTSGSEDEERIDEEVKENLKGIVMSCGDFEEESVEQLVNIITERLSNSKLMGLVRDRQNEIRDIILKSLEL